jgi:DNA-binding response OmpR family regulator/Tfp pilus assembly protein PilF
MFMIDKDIGTAQALIIDSNATSRSVLASQLRDLGVGEVKQTGRINDARLWLEQRPFDIVLCDYHFDNSAMSGQDLLDELRRENLLPYSTVFIMVTGEATYSKVVEAAESALDGYLLKPFTATALGDRLVEARRRKRTLKDIFSAMEANELGRASALCVQRFRKREPYAMFSARLGAELMLRQNLNDAARQFYDEALTVQDLPWARLGVSRALFAAGEIAPARRAIETLLRETPDYADAFDVLGRLQVDQGDLTAALATYRRAVELTPGCLLRLQHCGTLAFYQGENAAAVQYLERTVAMGLRSKLFDALSLMILAFLRYDSANNKGLQVCIDQLTRFAEQHSQSTRLRRFIKAATALRHLLARQPAEAETLIRELIAEVDTDGFDVEAASLLLSLVTRLPTTVGCLAEEGDLVRRLGMRFCVSKAITEVLLASARRMESAVETIRHCQLEISTIAEQAMSHSLRGSPQSAARTLLDEGQSTRNAKLIEMAGMVVRRHEEAIADSAELIGEADGLTRRFCQPITHIAGIRRTARSPGGLITRR